MVLALRFVLFERVSGTNPFTSDIPYRLNVLGGTKWYFSYVLYRLNVLDGTSLFKQWHSVPFKCFEWYKTIIGCGTENLTLLSFGRAIMKRLMWRSVHSR